MGWDWKRVLIYGAVLAAGAVALQWLDYNRMARTTTGDLYLLLVAVGFMGLGIWVGARLLGARPAAPFNGNPRAQAALGISARELAVLKELAAGYSNKEIAQRLHVSPNTVKTHVARLFEKLNAKRRTDAIARARELGLVP